MIQNRHLINGKLETWAFDEETYLYLHWYAIFQHNLNSTFIRAVSKETLLQVVLQIYSDDNNNNKQYIYNHDM